MILSLPPEVSDLEVVASVSGGKDSTALMLALRGAGIAFRAVFADTQWEADETYAYLDLLRDRLGIAIDVVGVEGGMVGRIRHHAGFPGRMQRWCTRELKIEPLRAYHDRLIAETGRETVCVMGIRADESPSRAKMAELEDEPPGYRSWGGWLWRPLLRWTIADVLAIHHRHNIPVHPHYPRGHNRVGCHPCIYANKEEIKLVSQYSPERIAKIRDLEKECDDKRAALNKETPGRYKDMKATFFKARHGLEPAGIDEVVVWSRTSHGGVQLRLLADAPTGGCMQWGMCDPPVKEAS